MMIAHINNDNDTDVTHIHTLAFLLLVPEGVGLLQLNLLLNFGFFVKLVEVVYDDGDGQRDAEHPTDRTNLTEKH